MFFHVKKGTLSLERKPYKKNDGVVTALEAIGWLVIVIGIIIGLAGVIIGPTNGGTFTTAIFLAGAAIVTLFGITILALGKIVEYLGIIANAGYQCVIDGLEGIIDDNPMKEEDSSVVAETITTVCPACKNTITIKEGEVCPHCKFNVSAYLKNSKNNN